MTAALEGGEWSAARLGRTLPPGKYPVPILTKHLKCQNNKIRNMARIKLQHYWHYHNYNEFQAPMQCIYTNI